MHAISQIDDGAPQVIYMPELIQAQGYERVKAGKSSILSPY
jgi:hypothetical protein